MNILFFIIYFNLLFSNVVNSLSLNRKTPIDNKPFNKIDNKIYRLTKPAVLNHVIVPVVGLVDSVWVGRLGNANMLAGQGCGDQVFTMAYYIFSFLPAVLAPEISKLYTQDKKEDILELINISIIISICFGIILTLLLGNYSQYLINFFISDKGNIRLYALEYLNHRIMAFPFIFLNSVIFSILRGMFDFNSAIKINIQSQLINLIIDPILMKRYGLKGVAIGSNIADVYCSLNYINLFRKKKLISCKLNNFLRWSKKLFVKGFFVQVKNICNNLMYLLINNKVIKLDNDGSQTAAHILSAKLYDIGGIMFHGLSSVASIIIPNEVLRKRDELTKERLIYWSNFIGVIQFFIYLLLIFNVNFLTNDISVAIQIKKLLVIISILQYFAGVTDVVEGILQGYQKYRIQSLLAIISLASMLTFTNYSNNIQQIWSIGIAISIFKLTLLKKFKILS